MTWTKTGDEFSDECWTLSDAAYRLHHEGLTWSNRKQTDGRLTKADMRRWAKRPEAAEELVAVGWWEDHGEHYQIIHHIGYQRTKAQIAKQSIANAENANRRWSKKRPNGKPSNGLSNDSQCDSHNDPQCDKDRTGQDRPGEQNRGTSLRNGQPKKIDQSADEDYAASVRDWYQEEP